MASHLDRWEKDPFFPAAEEVQQSADRMESTYRTLIHASKEPSVWNSEALRRDLRTALGTTKWQLEEFERAVISSYNKNSTDVTKERHQDFINAMESQVSKVESSLSESASTKKPPRPWIRLDEGERKELALFLQGSTAPREETTSNSSNGSKSDQKGRRKQKSDAKNDKISGHRRAASASADIGSWKINVDDDNNSPRGKNEKIPKKIPSFSGLLNTLEYSASKLKWSKNGYRKLREECDDKLLENRPLTKVNERSKLCAENCDDYYDKRIYGWFSGVKRRVQRSQYYMVYKRRTKMIFWVIFVICLLALIVTRLI